MKHTNSSPHVARRRLKAVAGWLLAAACGAYLVLHLQRSSEALRVAELRPGLLSAAAVFCLTAGQLLTGSITYTLLRGLGGKLSWPGVLRIHLMAQVTKYLPAGGIVHATTQTVTLGRMGQTGVLRTGFAIGMMLGIVCAGAASTYGIAQVAGGVPLSPLAALGIVALPAAVLLATSPVERWPAAGRLLARIGLHRPSFVEDPCHALRQAALLSGLALAAWGLFGLGAVALAVDLVPLSKRTAFQLIGAFALSWLVGFLVVITPAGLGVREVSLMLLLQPLLPPPWPAMFPIVARLAWVLADVLGFLVGWIGLRRLEAVSAAFDMAPPEAGRSSGEDAR